MLPADTLLRHRYRIVRSLSESEGSALYEALDEETGQTVAVKLWEGLSEAQHQALARDVEARAALHHPALAPILAHFAEEEAWAVVWEWKPGESLAERLAARQRVGRGPFGYSEVLRWADQLLGALGYLHARQPPLLHGGVTPQSVRLGAQGVVLVDAEPPLSGRRPVTPQPYRAPELWLGGTPDGRSDLYALAATLYHLLTGVEPPDALQRTDARRQGLPDPLRPAQEWTPHLPQALSEVLGQALALTPAERPATAASLRARLREAAYAPVGDTPTPVLESPAPGWLPPRDLPSAPAPAGEPIEGEPQEEGPAPPAKSSQRTCLWIGIAAALLAACIPCTLVALLVVFGPSLAERFQTIQPGSDTPAMQGDPVGDPVSVFDLEVGDCFNDPTEEEESSDGLVGELLVLDCMEPHDNEVFALLAFPAAEGNPFPAPQALDSYADDSCKEAFDLYVGMPYEESALFLWSIKPTEDTWALGDREIICALYDGDMGKLEGTMRDSRQ